jgi:hypothetical protein
MDSEKKGSGGEQTSINAAKPMPRGMLIVLIFAFYAIAFYSALSILDVIAANVALTVNTSETDALVTAKTLEQGKSGKKYKIEYTFTVDGTDYSRRVLFGLLPKKSALPKASYDSLTEGDSIKIIYARANPRYNKPANDHLNDNRLFLRIITLLVFGFMALNETKNLAKKKE